MAYTKYYLTPSNNNATPPDGAPEGMLPSAVNDTMRDMMAQIRDVGDGIRNGTYTQTAPVITGGSINNTPIGASTANTGAFTTVSATGDVSIADKIIHTGDTNTAIRFPAADTVTVETSGVERLRIDTSGNVGIGNISPATKLQITGSAQTTSPTLGSATGGSLYLNNTDANYGLLFGTSSSGSSWIQAQRTDGAATAYNITLNPSGGNIGIGISPTAKLHVAGTIQTVSGATTLQMFTDGGSNYMQAVGAYPLELKTTGSAPMVLHTNNTERMRINSSGNVGIGTSSPGFKLDVANSTNTVVKIKTTSAGSYGALQIFNSTTNGEASIGFRDDSDSDATSWVIGKSVGATDAFGFYNGSTKMLIDSSGNVGIGTSSPSSLLDVESAGDTSVEITKTGQSSWLLQTLNSGVLRVYSNTASTERMRITSDGEVYIAGTSDQGAYNLQVNGTGVWGAGAYVNGSDARIKEDVAPIDSGLDVVAKLNPVTYRYKETWTKDQSTQTGFIAQELLVALEGKNYVDGVVQQGGQYMSVAYQNIIPILTKAIQELKAELDATKAEVALLKSK